MTTETTFDLEEGRRHWNDYHNAPIELAGERYAGAWAVWENWARENFDDLLTQAALAAWYRSALEVLADESAYKNGGVIGVAPWTIAQAALAGVPR